MRYEVQYNAQSHRSKYNLPTFLFVTGSSVVSSQLLVTHGKIKSVSEVNFRKLLKNLHKQFTVLAILLNPFQNFSLQKRVKEISRYSRKKFIFGFQKSLSVRVRVRVRVRDKY